MDEDDGVDWVKKSLQAEGEKNRVKKQARLDAERALEEDPTIYQYDEIYSDIHVDPKQKKAEKKKEGPKYIKTLLQAAEKRKKEHELRIERMVQKEREAEGEMFKDKEKFVTASYRAKLEEMKKLEEEQKEMDRLETIGDVTKQGDVSGFYRHLYEQTFDKAKTDVKKEPVSKEPEIKKEPEEDKIEKSEENLDKDDSSVNDSSSEGGDENKKEAVKILTRTRKVKQFRQRVVEKSESEPEDDKEKEGNGKEEKEKDTHYKGEARLQDEKESAKEKREDENSRKRSLTPEVKEKDKENEDKNKEELENGSSKKKKEDEEKSKRKKAERRVSIWVKRTVGPVFDDALQRYYARKAMRVSGS